MSNLDCEDGIDERAWDRAMSAPISAPRRRRPGPRTLLRRDVAGGGWSYEIRIAGQLVADGWCAGGRSVAFRFAAARCETWRKTGRWVEDEPIVVTCSTEWHEQVKRTAPLWFRGWRWNEAGLWCDCPCCGSTLLVPSEEALNEMEAA